LYQRHHGVKTGAIRRFLMKSQYFPEARIRELQWEKLQTMLRFAYEHNRFYRWRFESVGITLDEIKTPEDFARLPILTKDDIRTNLNNMISDGYSVERLHWRRTGGSTGVPVQLYWDDEANTFKSALAYRHDSWANYLPGDKRALLWGNIPPPSNLKERLYNALYSRAIALDTLKMDPEYMLQFVEEVRRFKPRLLFGHGHSLYFFAQFLREHGITDIRFKGIISTAETLLPSERRLVEEVFGKIVFDRYGCEEVSLIASECEAHDGLHIAAEGLYVEVLDGTETVPGRLIITDLTNRGMPFIRYEIGDLATTKAGKCPCGRGLPRLGRVMGRTTDILYTPDGKQISGVSILDTFVIHIPGFRQVQIVQEKLDEVVFNIVKADDFSDRSLSRLAETVPKIFGPGMKYRVNFVDHIPKTSRGKFQFTVCKIKQPTAR
jgi:phenylacetate-CoA ligase